MPVFGDKPGEKPDQLQPELGPFDWIDHRSVAQIVAEREARRERERMTTRAGTYHPFHRYRRSAC